MSNIDAVVRTETSAPAPTTNDIKPPALKYTPQQASPSAAIDSVQANAAKGNMMANMHGGWVPDKRGIVNIVTNAASRSKKKGPRSKSKSKSKFGSRSRSRTIRRGGRGSLSRRFRKQGSSFKHRVSRRIRLRILQMRIKKRNIASASRSRSNAKMQKTMRGGDIQPIGGNDLVPQHGASCSGGADPNCPGLAAASLLTASRQSTVNAHGDSK